MDSGGGLKPALRYDHLQRLLKQYELEALNSLRGPATLSASTADSISSLSSVVDRCQNPQVQSQAGTTTEVEKTSLLSSHGASSALHRHNNKTLDGGSSFGSSSSSTNVRRSDDSELGTERLSGIDRSVLRQQENLLKEIMAMRGAIPVQPLPVLMAQDRASSGTERKETLLEGEVITCFVVGGEKRLCLPQVLNTVLKSVSMVDINRACTELNIHCGHCTPEQLLVLKIAGVVSATTASSSLITKTDAERLCDYLLRQRGIEKRLFPLSLSNPKNGTGLAVSQPQGASTIAVGSIVKGESATLSEKLLSSFQQHALDVSDAKTTIGGINVIHFCFGRCRGRYYPSLYASPSAECIECDECGQLFAPDRFVVHSHGNQERRICHWGFDSANWRAYLHLTDDDECEENMKILEAMKLRFDVTGLTKRRPHSDNDLDNTKATVMDDDVQSNSKRIRLDSAGQHAKAQHQPTISMGVPLAEPSTKAVISVPSVAPFIPGLDSAALPYLLCDPVLLAAFAAATATIRAATGPQLMQSSAPMVPTSLLPHFTTPSTLATPFKQQSWPIFNAGSVSDGLGIKAPHVQMQTLQSNSQQSVDEATAAAALRLLQLHASNGNDQSKQIVDKSKEQLSCEASKWYQGGDVEQHNRSIANKVTMAHSNQQPSHSFGKESFKKQLLHLFAAEQQGKADQDHRQCQAVMTSKVDLERRKSVEIVVDDNDLKPAIMSRLFQSTPKCEMEKRDNSATAGDVATPETQVADEFSISSSDNEGIGGDLSLDELLRRYITDEDGLKVVRAKIAENQRYLEQKLDSVSAQNRILHAECLQLRMQEKRDSEVHFAKNSLGRDVAGNLLGLLPRPFAV